VAELADALDLGSSAARRRGSTPLSRMFHTSQTLFGTGERVDRVSPTCRSHIMRSVRGSDTSPEIAVRRILHRAGFRFRLQRKDVMGRPDLVFPSRKAAVFVHGCFWHRHRGCDKATTPKTNVDFWETKFRANVVRDRRINKRLRNQGWQVITIWECELKRPERLLHHLKKELTKPA
jgi:DNA mismatch endonuclease, patch repair protein